VNDTVTQGMLANCLAWLDAIERKVGQGVVLDCMPNNIAGRHMMRQHLTEQRSLTRHDEVPVLLRPDDRLELYRFLAEAVRVRSARRHLLHITPEELALGEREIQRARILMSLVAGADWVCDRCRHEHRQHSHAGCRVLRCRCETSFRPRPPGDTLAGEAEALRGLVDTLMDAQLADLERQVTSTTQGGHDAG
jgi:hypothetical protein